MRISSKLVQATMDQMSGILDHAPLDTRLARVRDLFERIEVDSRESNAIAVCRATTDEGQ